MAPFGKYLSNRGFVPRPVLEEATQAMVVFGGRLGTHLVESGALSLEQLEGYLAEYLSVSTPSSEALMRPDAAALSALPRHRVIEVKVLPFQLEGRTLHVAMRDPRDTALVGELARETGLRIRPYLLSEVRLFFLLQQHFGIDPSARYERKTDDGAEGQAETRRPALKATPEDDALARERRALGIADLSESEELLDKGTFESMLATRSPADGPVAPVAPTERVEAPSPHGPTRGTERALAPRKGATPPSIDALSAALEAAQERSEVARHTVQIARHHVPVAGLFTVRDGLVQLLRASSALGTDDIEALPLPLAPAALANETDEHGALERGAPWPGSLAETLGRALGRQAVRDAAVYPVMLVGRLVNLLYVDNGPEHLDPACTPALRELCEQVSKAYERIILSKKKTLL